MISLREVTAENYERVCALSDGVDESQVAPNGLSVSEALLRDDSWLRAIYMEETPVGLVMVQDILDWHVYHLWRLMIAPMFQRCGYGRAAMELIIGRYRRRPGAHRMTTFVSTAAGNAEPFYAKLGFKRDGRDQMNQIGLELVWAEPLAKDAWPPLPQDATVTLEPVRSGDLRTIGRAYLTLEQSERECIANPWTAVAQSKLGHSPCDVRSICADGYAIGYAICDAAGRRILSQCIAAPYREMNLQLPNGGTEGNLK